MGLFDFRESIRSNKEKSKRPILALALEENFAQACVFKVEGQKIDILASEETTYPKEEILPTLTFFLKKLIEKGEDWRSLDIVFGLPADWIQEEKIKDPFKDLISQIASNLTLNPLAFVSIPKALAFLIAQNEKVKLSALLIGIGKKSFTLNFIQNGEVERAVRVPLQEEDYGRQIQSSLFGLGVNLPPRIIIYGRDDLAKIREVLTGFFWPPPEEGPSSFLHPPKVEQLERETLLEALAFAAAVDLDLLSQPQELFEKAKEKKEKEEVGKKDQFGFVYDQDVFASFKPRPFATPPLPPEELEEEQRQGIKRNLPLFLIQNFFQFPFWIWQAKKGRLFLAVFLLPLFLFIFLFALWWVVPSASVELLVYSKVLEKSVQVEVDPLLGQTTAQEEKITGQVIEVEVADSQKGLTSGKKTIGEKARGEVTIFNKTSAQRTFAAGTIITTGGLRFSFDSQVSVASRSATVEGIIYGKNKVGVTAQEIGEKGNVEAGLDFSVADFDQSLYSAHNDQAFSGGSQREVNVVSEEDRRRLADSLDGLLLAKASQELNSKLQPGWKIEEGAITSSLVSQKFDKAVGEEAQILNLSQEKKFKATAYKEEDLKTVLEKELSTASPQDYEIEEGSQDTKIAVAKISPSGNLFLEIKFKANIMPKFETSQVRRNLVGKRPEAAKNYLLSLPQVASAKVFVYPPLPLFLKTMPHLTSRIKIKTSSQPTT
jgi:hypothetical protein